MLVHNKGKYVRHAVDVTIVPGANQVDSEDFKKFSGNAIMKTLIEKGEIVPQKSLKEMNADEAVTLVKDTYSLSLLEEMRAGEKRKTVLEAIDEQTAHITGEGEEEDENE